MDLKLAGLILAFVMSKIEGRPQETVIENKEDTGLLRILANMFGFGDKGRAFNTGSSLLREFSSTGRAVGNGIGMFVSDFWTAGAQALIRMNSAFRETAVEALKGVSNVMSATGDVMQDTIHAGGKLMSNAGTNSLKISRDAVVAAGRFVNSMAQSTTRGFGETARSTVDFVDGAVDGIGR